MSEQPQGSNVRLTDSLLAALNQRADELVKQQAKINAELFAETVAALKVISATVKRDREEFAKRNQEQVKGFNKRNFRQWVAFLALAAVFLLLAVLNRRTLTTIQSCTDQNGSCAKRGAAEQVILLDALVYCERTLPVRVSREAAMECVRTELKEFNDLNAVATPSLTPSPAPVP